MKTKFPATVMVFDVVSSEGYIMPLHIFEIGLKVNTKLYLDLLKSVVIAAIRRVSTELTPALVEKACSQFRIRIKAAIEVEGGYIE